MLWAGWPFFVRGWQSLLTRNLNMFTLIAVGTGVAYLYSVVGTVAPGIFPATFRGHGGAVAVYFEVRRRHHRARPARPGAGTARPRSDVGRDQGAAAARAENRAPDRRRRRRSEVEIDSLRSAISLRVRPGEKVPVDGVILEGRSSLDESLVTGESMPVTKEPGAKVIAGTLNHPAVL